MGWERGRYYTRSRKVDGKVVREYVGGGTLGQMAALLDAEDRMEREAARREAIHERERLEGLDAPVQELNDLANLLVRAVLVSAGFRQHHRGGWRRKRVHTDQTD